MLQRILLGTILSLTALSCGGSSGSSAPSGPGHLTLLATDAPFAHDVVELATIDVAEVRVHREGAGWLTLYDGPAITLDLLHLRNGLTQTLVDIDVPAGDYDQLRLILDSAALRLIDGDEFSPQLQNMHMTSTDTSGLKLFVEPPMHVPAGGMESLLLDFDLSKTFHPVPGNDPLNANSYNLMPVVHCANLGLAAEMRGVVREDDGTGTLVGVADATVYLLLPGETDLGAALQSTGTGPDGSYAILGVDPGDGDVVAAKGARSARSDGHSFTAGAVTTVDFVLP